MDTGKRKGGQSLDRATIRMDASLQQRLKVLAAVKGISLYTAVNQAVAHFLTSEEGRLLSTKSSVKPHRR